MMQKEILKRLFFSLNRALSGEQILNIKIINAIFNSKNKELLLNFYFEKNPTESDIELMHEIGSEITSDFHESEIKFINEEALLYDCKKPLNKLPGIILYSSEK